MKSIIFIYGLFLLAGSANAAVIDAKDVLPHDFQKLSSTANRHLAMLSPSIAKPAVIQSPTAKAGTQAELLGLVGVGMVGLATRRRKRLF